MANGSSRILKHPPNPPSFGRTHISTTTGHWEDYEEWQYDNIYSARKPSKTHDAFLKRHAKCDYPVRGSVHLSKFDGVYFSVWSWIDGIDNAGLNDLIYQANTVYDERRAGPANTMYASPWFNRKRVEMYLKRLGILTW